MPRRYDVSLLEQMNKNAREEVYEGVRVLVEPIPEGGAPGEMDPRLYKSMKMMPLQVLLYPAVNLAGKHTEFYHGAQPEKYRVGRRHARVLNTVLKVMGGMMNDLSLFDDVYLQGNLPADHVYASPLLDDFHDLPATLLMFGEHDMLVFEDFAYAKTAANAGVSLKTVVYEGLSHGFADQIGVQPQAEDVMQEIAGEMWKL